MKNIFFYVILFLTSFISECKAQNSKCNYWEILHFNINKNSYDLLNGKCLIEIMNNNSTKSINLKFVNNPLNLNSSNNIIILLDNYIIYNHCYPKVQNKKSLRIPYF